MDNTKGQVENLLAELGKKIDVLIEETKHAGSDVHEDLDKKIKQLKKKKEKIEKDFEGYKDKNEDKWQDAKSHLTQALNEMVKAVEVIFKDKKG